MTPQQLKAMKLALEALETELSIDWTNNDEFNASAEKMYEAITAIKEALAEHAMRETQKLGQEIEQCQCTECQIKPHASDCAVHSEPAYPKGKCDCGAQTEQEPVAECPNLKGKSMNKDEALTLEALKFAASKGYGRIVHDMKITPFTIKYEEALAQPEQEPVAHCKVRPLRGDESFPKVEIDWVNQPVPGPLYTSPPQRTWVGLTGIDQKELMAMSARDAVFATEAKLKERNQ